MSYQLELIADAVNKPEVSEQGSVLFWNLCPILGMVYLIVYM